ncbi:MAG: ribulose-phosphate 3-epimerase [Deltaproteobacteria bacterium]|nr:ribulose-phosphate 3-epimerase [Deltaproteobacteria bacterium]
MIAPSVLSADFGRLHEEVRAAEAAGADWLHLDVMDGHFVPNLTMGPDVVKAIRRATSLPLDVHMMVSDPGRYAPRFIDVGADWVSIHYEACPEPRGVLADIRTRGARPSLAVSPDTPVAVVAPSARDLDMVLVMSVHPGFGGQKFLPGSLAKLEDARRLRDRLGLGFLIEVDGGVTVENAEAAARAGADVLVAGTAVFGATDYATAITAMRQAGAAAAAPA